MDSKERTMSVDLSEVTQPIGTDTYNQQLTKNHYISRGTNVYFSNKVWSVVDQYNRYVLLKDDQGYLTRAIKDQTFGTSQDIQDGQIKDRSIKTDKPPKSHIEKIKKPKVARKTKKKTFIPIAAHEAFQARLKEYQAGGRTITCFQYEPQGAEKYEFRIITGSKSSPWILLTSSKWEFGVYYFYNVETAQYLKYDEATHKNGKEVIWPEVA